MREIIVDNNVCNNDYYTELNLSFFSSLRVFEVGDYSLLFVKEVKLITLSQLERVVIGKGQGTFFRKPPIADCNGTYLTQ